MSDDLSDLFDNNRRWAAKMEGREPGFFTKLFYLVTGIHHEGVIIFFVISGFLIGGRAWGQIESGEFSWTRYFVERFTRIGPKTLQWDVTVNDPSTWTKPWTARLLLRSSPDPIFEMACHEGNDGLVGALSGQRALENEAAKKSSR